MSDDVNAGTGFGCFWICLGVAVVICAFGWMVQGFPKFWQ